MRFEGSFWFLVLKAQPGDRAELARYRGKLRVSGKLKNYVWKRP